MTFRKWVYPLNLITIAAIYYFAAKLGLSMPSPEAGEITLVWPPTGIALAAVLLLGYRIWPGIALGAFLANYLIPTETIGVACGIAIGNTGEALLGAWLLHRVAGFQPALSRLTDVISLVTLAAVISTMLSATIGVASLCLGSVRSWNDFGSHWTVWWLGDAMGALVVGPAVLVWATRPRAAWRMPQINEALILFILLASVGLAVFAKPFSWLTIDHPLEYVIFPFVIWAALRLGQAGTTMVTLVASVIAIGGTARGMGPFTANSPHESLLLLQLFLGVVSVTGLLLGAAIAERNLADRRRAADYAITQVLAQSTGLKEAVPSILRTICETLEWDVGALWAVDERHGVLRCIELWHQPSVKVPEFEAVSREYPFAMGSGLPGRVWKNRESAWIPDVTRDANFPRAPVAVRENLHAAFGFPIRRGDKIVGVIEFFSREIRQPDFDLLQLFAAAGSQIGLFIERTRSEQTLQTSEARKTAILETALDCIITIDHDGTIIEFNSAAEKTFGYQRDEVIGRSMSEFIIPPSLRQQHREGFAHYLSTGESRVLNRRIEVTAMRSDGTEFPVELAITPIAMRDQPMFTAHLRDITDRRRLEEELRLRAEELVEADRRKDEFLAILAHELRNPLAPVRNALQIMRLTGSSPQLQEMMERQVNQLVRLVDDLLEVARITRGHIELRMERVELATIIENALETSRPLLEASGHRPIVRCPTEAIVLNADPLRLAQVFSNLLNNSAKYTDPGGNIELVAAREAEEAVVRIRDTGIGISADMLSRIFEKFTQADRSSDRARGGLGIGLNLVRSLVAMHGGSVTAASAGVGMGSEFTIHLPLATDQRPVEKITSDSPLSRRPEARSSRILVVDDNRDVAHSLAMLLKFTGNEVEVAHDGPAALEAVRRQQPDVVLLDIGMPEMDGYEVAQRLRADPKLDHLVLVALTGWSQEEDRRRSQESGFDFHLIKPVKLEALESLLASVERRARTSAGALADAEAASHRGA